MEPNRLSACRAAALIEQGELTSTALVRACLDRIEAVEPDLKAWTRLDPDHALRQAEHADEQRRRGRSLGPLHGLPVGIKDIFDTHDFPTENGSVLHAGRSTEADATAVARLREAGAIVLGKTVTTEFACYAPGKTTNPHDSSRTPGGSSSGSAAAVAACMVPLAVGSQTNGSVIRPAAYCGIVGFKPTHGAISRNRVLPLSRVLDHVGVFARSIEDVAFVSDQLCGFDEHDPGTSARARSRLLETASVDPPAAPRLALVKTPMWDEADEACRSAFSNLAKQLGGVVEEVELPPVFEQAVAWHRIIMEADLARNLAKEFARGADRLSPSLREMIERGQCHTAVAYNDAVGAIDTLNAGLNAVFEHYDTILTPAAAGEAPVGLDSTGSPVFCTIWTLCGVPAVTVPLLEGTNGLPIGVQLVGQKWDDGRVLRTGRWLVGETSQ